MRRVAPTSTPPSDLGRSETTTHFGTSTRKNVLRAWKVTHIDRSRGTSTPSSSASRSRCVCTEMAALPRGMVCSCRRNHYTHLTRVFGDRRVMYGDREPLGSTTGTEGKHRSSRQNRTNKRSLARYTYAMYARQDTINHAHHAERDTTTRPQFQFVCTATIIFALDPSYPCKSSHSHTLT